MLKGLITVVGFFLLIVGTMGAQAPIYDFSTSEDAGVIEMVNYSNSLTEEPNSVYAILEESADDSEISGAYVVHEDSGEIYDRQAYTSPDNSIQLDRPADASNYEIQVVDRNEKLIGVAELPRNKIGSDWF